MSNSGAAGGMIYCKGTIVQNFVAYNEAAVRGGGIFGSHNALISGNVFYKNKAQTGAGISDTTEATIEQNTIYGNDATANYGGLYKVTEGTNGVVRNNILWANLNGEMDSLSDSDYSAIDEDDDPGGTGNIGPWTDDSDLKFVSTEFVESFEFFDDFDDGQYLDEWDVVDPGWSVVSQWLLNDPENTPDELSYDRDPSRIAESADLDLTFSYFRLNGPMTPGDEWLGQLTIYFRFDDEGVEKRRAGLTIRENRINLWEWVSTSTPEQYPMVETIVSSDRNVQYDVRLEARGPNVRVWWGRHDEPMTQILGTSDHKVLQSKSLNIRVQQLGYFALDDILIEGKNNLGEFLHLDEDSPCIDMGDTPTDGQGNPIVYRDFDDMMGPLDADGFDTVDNDGVFIERDIGADEWPQPEASSFWWQNF